jgi:hypothetical protein
MRSDIDFDPPTPVEVIQTRKRVIRWLVIAALILLGLYYLIFVNQYVIAYKDDLEHFKHGSIGSEPENGLPYLVFRALPVMYRDQLGPGGYRKLGFLYETPGDDLPIGVSRRIVDGVERVWLNCAVCHVGTYRLSETDAPTYLYGAPSNNLRLFEFINFLLKVGDDPGFSADALIAAIDSPEVGGRFNVFQEALYRQIVFPRVQSALQGLGKTLSFVHRQADWGPGRVDTFNPYKAIQFGMPLDKAHIADWQLNASSDYPSIWSQRGRVGMNLHWDGNNSSVQERDLSAALGAGVTPTTVDRPGIARVEHWIWDLAPPSFPAAIDDRATRGSTQHIAPTVTACVIRFRARTATTAIASRDSARSRLSIRSGLTPGVGPPTRRNSPPRRICYSRATHGASRISARPTATPINHLTPSGRARPTYTTALCQPCGIYSSRRLADPSSGIAAPISST